MGSDALEPDHDAPVEFGPVKRVVVAGGTGLIGRALVAALLRDGVSVGVLTRDPAGRSAQIDAGARAIAWDPSDEASTPALGAALAGVDAVVNVTGVPVGPLPWTPGRKRAIVASRVGTTQRLVEAIATLEPSDRPRAFVNAAGTDGYTGLDAEPATEATDASATPGFLGRLGRDWEAAASPARELGVRVALVRTAIVFGREASLLRLVALPVRLGLGGPYGDGRQWFSWIHLDDLVAVYRRAIDDDSIDGPINAASPEPPRQIEVARALGRVLHRPIWFPAPAWLLRLVLREQATLLLGSRRVDPARLRDIGFQWSFGDLEAALRESLDRPA
jgi:uncharacterized protein